jgi:hypothetical protein
LLQVAEATARKKMRAKKAMEKAKAKANSIAESDEMGVKAKQRSIEKLCDAAEAGACAVLTSMQVPQGAGQDEAGGKEGEQAGQHAAEGLEEAA